MPTYRPSSTGALAVSIAIATVAGLSVPVAASADLTDATVAVPSRGPTASGATTPVSTPDVLTPGTIYAVAVAGSFSPWDVTLWAQIPTYFFSCGLPESAPLYPSPGRPVGPTGNDAAFQYAGVGRRGCGTTPYPRSSKSLQISTGGAFAPPQYSGAPTAPAADHAYRFTVVGTGQPLQLRIRDAATNDNYGEFRVAISSTAVPAKPLPAPDVVATATSPATGVAATSGSRPTQPIKRPVVVPCTSRRLIIIHLRSKHLRRVRARLTGTRVHRDLRTVIGKRLTRTRVDLRGLRPSTYRVTLRLVRKSGQHQTVVRRYRTCVPR